MDPGTPAAIRFGFVSFNAQHRHGVRLIPETRNKPIVQQEAVRHQKKDHPPEIPRYVDDLGPHQGLSTGYHKERHSQLLCLGHDTSEGLGGQLLGSLSTDRLRIASLAPQVAPIGDAENGDGRDVQAFAGGGGSAARRPALPDNCLCKECSLTRSAQADADELGEEDADAQIELRGRGLLDSHRVVVLLR